MDRGWRPLLGVELVPRLENAMHMLYLDGTWVATVELGREGLYNLTGIYVSSGQYAVYAMRASTTFRACRLVLGREHAVHDTWRLGSSIHCRGSLSAGHSSHRPSWEDRQVEIPCGAGLYPMASWGGERRGDGCCAGALTPWEPG